MYHNNGIFHLQQTKIVQACGQKESTLTGRLTTLISQSPLIGLTKK